MPPGTNRSASSRDGLAAAADVAVRCLGVNASEDVLVVCNEQQRSVAESLAGAAGGDARSVRLIVYPALTRDGEEPPAFVAEAMAHAAVIFAPTTCSLSHTRARTEATRRGARIATLPGITEATFARAMPADYEELGRAGERIAAELSAAAACRLTSPAGTEVALEPWPHSGDRRRQPPGSRRIRKSPGRRSLHRARGRKCRRHGLLRRFAR